MFTFLSKPFVLHFISQDIFGRFEIADHNETVFVYLEQRYSNGRIKFARKEGTCNREQATQAPQNINEVEVNRRHGDLFRDYLDKSR